MNAEITDQSVTVAVKVPLADVLRAHDVASGSQGDVLPLAAMSALVRRFGEEFGQVVSEALGPQGGGQYHPVESLPASATFTEWMAFEEEEVPAEWRVALDEAYADATRDLPRRVDLRREGLGPLVRDMVDAFEEGGDDGCRQAAEVARFCERVAALELFALDALPEGGKVADLSFPELARRADCTKELGFEARRKAAGDASSRLELELDEGEIDRLHVHLEAEARRAFLGKVAAFLEQRMDAGTADR